MGFHHIGIQSIREFYCLHIFCAWLGRVSGPVVAVLLGMFADAVIIDVGFLTYERAPSAVR